MQHRRLSNRVVLLLILLVLGFLLLSAPAFADVCAPEVEPNSALASATPLGELGGSQPIDHG